MSDKEQISKDLQLNRSGWSTIMLQVRSLQGCHSFFKHFKDEFKTFKRQLRELEKSERAVDDSIAITEKLNADNLARGYFKLIRNIHPYPHHLGEIAEDLQVGNSLYLKINVFERFLHAVDKIDPNFYQNPLHKQEVKEVIMNTLEDLYDQLEEKEEEAEVEEDYLYEYDEE